MAVSKTILASSSYIVYPNTIGTGFIIPTLGSGIAPATFAQEPEVFNNVFTSVYSTAASFRADFAGNLVNTNRMTKPGVFTAGTPQEGTASNPNNDGNQ